MLSILLEAAVRSLILTGFVLIALKVLRVTNPSTRLPVWTGVLCAALIMPLLVLASRTPGAWPIFPAWLALEGVTAMPAATEDALSRSAVSLFSGWQTAAEIVYATVAAILLLRVVIGLARGWALLARATLIDEPRACGERVCVSREVNAPMVFGSTILLPASSEHWSASKRLAALAHERSHLARGDFYVQILANVHRAIFWFTPLAWWLARQLSTLAEIVSDDTAAIAVGNRIYYAEILMEVARDAHAVSVGVPMARGPNVSQRIARLLSAIDLSTPVSVLHRAVIALALVPVIFLSAGAMAQSQKKKDVIVPPHNDPANPVSRPVYPAAVKTRGESGVVIMMLTVERDGSVSKAIIDKSSGYDDLDESARGAALMSWHLLPGTVNGKPQAMPYKFAVTFKLADPPAQQKPQEP